MIARLGISLAFHQSQNGSRNGNTLEVIQTFEVSDQADDTLSAFEELPR